MTILIPILIVLGAFSLFLAYSGYLVGRTSLGWIVLAAFVVFYLPFAYRVASGLQLSSLADVFSALAVVAICVLPLLTQGPLLAELISQTIVPDPSKGIKLIKVYSEAEKKVIQDDLAGAIAEYEKVIAEDPDDVAARFRLADLCAQNEEYRKAAMAYEAIISRFERLHMSQHCTARTRLSEIYETHLDDPEAARKHLQAIIDKYPGTKYAGYAVERLENV